MLAAVPSSIFLDVVADAIEADAADDINIGLFTGAPTLSPATTLATLVALAPTFTGYAVVNVPFSARRGNANGDIILPLPAASFQPSDNVGLPITVTGFYIGREGTPDVLWLSEMLDEEWEVTSSGSALDVISEIYVKADENWGGICTTCST